LKSKVIKFVGDSSM